VTIAVFQDLRRDTDLGIARLWDTEGFGNLIHGILRWQGSALVDVVLSEFPFALPLRLQIAPGSHGSRPPACLDLTQLLQGLHLRLSGPSASWWPCRCVRTM
jgi:hypothetical protein